MDRNQFFAELARQVDTLTYIMFSSYFSFARTLADNRDNGKRGWALFSLIVMNSAIAVAGGLMTGPISELLNLNQPLRLALAGLMGWVGVGQFMSLLETHLKRRFGAYGNTGNAPGDSITSGTAPLQEDQ